MAESYNLHPHSPLWDLGRYIEISGFIYTYCIEPSPAGEDWSEEAVPVVVQELEVEAVGDLGLGHGDPAPVLGVEHSVRVLGDRRHPDPGLQHPQQRGLQVCISWSVMEWTLVTLLQPESLIRGHSQRYDGAACTDDVLVWSAATRWLCLLWLPLT